MVTQLTETISFRNGKLPGVSTGSHPWTKSPEAVGVDLLGLRKPHLLPKCSKRYGNMLQGVLPSIQCIGSKRRANAIFLTVALKHPFPHCYTHTAGCKHFTEGILSFRCCSIERIKNESLLENGDCWGLGSLLSFSASDTKSSTCRWGVPERARDAFLNCSGKTTLWFLAWKWR